MQRSLCNLSFFFLRISGEEDLVESGKPEVVLKVTLDDHMQQQYIDAYLHKNILCGNLDRTILMWGILSITYLRVT